MYNLARKQSNMQFDLLQEIIEEYRIYLLDSQVEGNQTIEDFGYWLNQRQQKPMRSKEETSLDVNNVDEEVSRLMVKMYRYARIHLKNSMGDISDLVQEDFTYLYALKRAGSLSKKELIELNIHEKSTGLEVIKRLTQNGLVEEKTDENDRRSKRLTMTKKGDKLFYKSKEVTKNVAKLITGKLTVSEKNNLHAILRKLDKFHQPIYLDRKEGDIKELLDSYSLN